MDFVYSKLVTMLTQQLQTKKEVSAFSLFSSLSHYKSYGNGCE